MRLFLKVIPAARRNEFKQEGESIKIYLNAPAVEGKANAALVKFLAEHYGVKSSQIEIIKGLKSRQKVINIKSI